MRGEGGVGGLSPSGSEQGVSAGRRAARVRMLPRGDGGHGVSGRGRGHSST